MPEKIENKRKLRSKPVPAAEFYDNCMLQRPDGQFLCYCNFKKFNWYVERNLAIVDPENPKIARLQFQPKGVGKFGQPFYMLPMDGKCCVCGSEKELSLHHIIPYQYRKHFPLKYKQYMNHDVLCTCTSCHADYETFHAESRKVELFQTHLPQYNTKEYADSALEAKITAKLAVGWEHVSHNPKVPKNIVEAKQNELIRRLGHLPTPEEALKLRKESRKAVFYRSCGKQLIEILVQDKYMFEQFIRDWRQHFLDTMNPKFLPPHWKVDMECTSETKARILLNSETPPNLTT